MTTLLTLISEDDQIFHYLIPTELREEVIACNGKSLEDNPHLNVALGNFNRS